jgi:hypothetical protein
MMHGLRNLLPTGGRHEMFERKWLEWDPEYERFDGSYA